MEVFPGVKGLQAFPGLLELEESATGLARPRSGEDSTAGIAEMFNFLEKADLGICCPCSLVDAPWAAVHDAGGERGLHVPADPGKLPSNSAPARSWAQHSSISAVIKNSGELDRPSMDSESDSVSTYFAASSFTEED